MSLRPIAFCVSCETDSPYVRAGGLYSTPKDLTRFIRSILNNELLGKAKTNEWLKPTGFTSFLDNSVGASWEIFRPIGLTRGSRPADHYTKSGGLPGYGSTMVLVPEYGLGVSILVASPAAPRVASLLLDTIQTTLIPALDDLARSQARSLYAGDYVLESGDSSAAMSLTIDDGPGLKVSTWNNRGVDMLISFDTLFYNQAEGKAVPVDARLYPTGMGNRWRIVFSEGETENSTSRKSAVKGDDCVSWYMADGLYYGKSPVDKVYFRVADDGKVEGLDIPILRTKLEKTQLRDHVGICSFSRLQTWDYLTSQVSR